MSGQLSPEGYPPTAPPTHSETIASTSTRSRPTDQFISIPTSTTPSSAQDAIQDGSLPQDSEPTEATPVGTDPAGSKFTEAKSSTTASREEAAGASVATNDLDATLEGDESAAVHIALLLTSSKRHPYKIDKRYLSKRGINLEDPWDLPVSTLKELILRDWREDWEDAPASAAYIRLISMGNELQDGELLKDKRFNRTGTNIVHMVIKREIPDDEEMKGGADATSSGRGRGRAQTERNGPCCCIVM